MKRFFNKIRYQYHLSLLARHITRPVEQLCRIVADQIRMKVWVNGGTVNYDGMKITFPRNVGVSYASDIFWNDVDGFEPNTWRVIKHFLGQSSLFIDVGSNIGLYSILAKKVNPDLRILAYEPVPQHFHKEYCISSE